ncbi:MAG: hypothetical protein ACR2N3_06225 [Pyrinomonadaceae bacterium]
MSDSSRKFNYELSRLRKQNSLPAEFGEQQPLYNISRLITYRFNIFETKGKLREILSREIFFKEIHSTVYLVSNNNQLKISNSSSLGKRQNLFAEEWNRELLGIYKSIGRYFIKTRLCEHLKCIRDCGKRVWWDRHISTCGGRICRSANAYLLWRMCFEGLNHPMVLFGKYRSLSLAGPLIQWDPPSYLLPLPVLKRVFALECYWLFYECKLAADILSANGVYSFNTKYITRRLMPHWIVIRSDIKDNLTEFHWWIDKEILRKQHEVHKHMKGKELKPLTTLSSNG